MADIPISTRLGLVIGLRRAGLLKWLMVVGWFLFPVLVQTIRYPTDAAGFFCWLNSIPVPEAFTAHQVIVGEVEAIVALLVAMLVQFWVTVLMYRRAQFRVMLWPFAALLVGVVGNAGWWLGTGIYDGSGMLAGWAPAVMAGIYGAICEKLSTDFILGPERAFDAG